MKKKKNKKKKKIKRKRRTKRRIRKKGDRKVNMPKGKRNLATKKVKLR